MAVIRSAALLINPEIEYLRLMTDAVQAQSTLAVETLNKLDVPILRCASKAIEGQNRMLELQMAYIEELAAKIERMR